MVEGGLDDPDPVTGYPFHGVGALPLPAAASTLNGFARQLGHGVRNHVPP